MSHEILLVGHSDDDLLDAVAVAAELRGLNPLRLTPRGLADIVTIEARWPEVLVQPDVPVLLRAVQERQGVRPSGDEAFSNAEILAAVWSACALSGTTVINRPGLAGVSGAAVTPVVLAGVRALGPPAVFPNGPVLQETFVTEPSLTREPGTEVQDLGTYDCSWSPRRPAGAGPYRIRGGWQDCDLAVVTVAAGRCWTRRPALCARNDLIQRTLSVVGGLDISFATVTWYVREDGDSEAGVALARIDPVPSAMTLGPFLAQVADTLVSALTSPETANQTWRA